MSGKLNEVINLGVGEIDWLSPGRYDWLGEIEPPLGPIHYGLRNRAFNAAQDELARGAVPPGCRFMQSLVEIAGNIDTGADGFRLHTSSVAQRLK